MNFLNCEWLVECNSYQVISNAQLINIYELYIHMPPDKNINQHKAYLFKQKKESVKLHCCMQLHYQVRSDLPMRRT